MQIKPNLNRHTSAAPWPGLPSPPSPSQQHQSDSAGTPDATQTHPSSSPIVGETASQSGSTGNYQISSGTGQMLRASQGQITCVCRTQKPAVYAHMSQKPQESKRRSRGEDLPGSQLLSVPKALACACPCTPTGSSNNLALAV